MDETGENRMGEEEERAVVTQAGEGQDVGLLQYTQILCQSLPLHWPLLV